MPLRAASFRTDTLNLLRLFWLEKPRKATSLGLVFMASINYTFGFVPWRERGSCCDGV